MNKSLLALAIAGALAASAAAQAETTLYGKVRESVNYTQNKDTDVNSWDVKNNSSRLGVRGSEDLGGGLSAIYQYEFGVNADGNNAGNPFSQRLSWVGVKGGFGSMTIGRQYSVYYNATGLDDVWNSDDTGTSWFASNRNSRYSNMVAYTSPDFSGFSVAGAVVADGQGNGESGSTATSNSVDLWEVAASYKNGPLNVGAGYRKQRSANGEMAGYTGAYPADASVWGLAASYNFGGVFNLIATYQEASEDFGGGRDFSPKSAGLTGEYTIGNTIVRAGWNRLDSDGAVTKDGNDSFNNWKLGVQYNLSKRTSLWAEYQDADFATGAGYLPAGTAYSNLALGLTHNF